MDINALPILCYEQLCEKLRIDSELRELRSLFGLDDNVFNVLVQPAFSRYLEAVQLAPASEAHHHCGPGGLALHTYEVITLALRMRRGMQLPVGGSISVINEKRHLWTYGVFAGCLLHDIGKLAASIRIQMTMRNGGFRLWNPHDEPMSTFKDALHYQIRFIKTPYAYHHHISLSFFDLLPQMARSWIANEFELMKQLCAHLRGDRFESGTIGELVEKADMQSTAKNLKEPVSQKFSDAVPVIDRFIGLIRGWIKDNQVRINVNGGMGWVDTQGHCYFVCRSLAEKLIVDCEEKGITDVPRDPIRIYDTLQEHGYAIPTEDGKAVHTITVVGDGFQHKFTCLKFEARRLTVPTRPLPPFTGKILNPEETEAWLASVASQQAAVPEAQPETASENSANTTNTANASENAGSQEAANPPSSEPTPPATATDQTVATSHTRESAPEAAENGSPPAEHAEEIQESLVFAAAKKDRPRRERETAREAEEKIQETAAESSSATQAVASAPDTEQRVPSGTTQREPEAIMPPVAETAMDQVQPGTAPTLEVVDYVSIEHAAPPQAARMQPQGSAQKRPETAKQEADPGKSQETAARSCEPETEKKKPENAVVTSLPGYKGLEISNPDIGMLFYRWIKKGLIEKTILINDPNAFVHMVKEGIFLLSPAIFKDFCIKHGMEESDHRALSKKFDRLKLHKKSDKGLNIHPYWAVSTSRAGKMNGRILPFNTVFEHDHPIPPLNKFVSAKWPGTDPTSEQNP